ncbi:MAG: glucosaminidase domain-containing protein [Prevotellaceae bacterium]|jgi:LysM repeat protein|nr:glucosaminidase domain-containing protein [Prevotellaceae bacterium]
MMRKKSICLLMMAVLLSSNVLGQTFYKVYDWYIADYQENAMETMLKYNVPASILLAQGMLESQGGTSVLAVEANNHFGIKCQDWDGETFMYKANEFVEEECFRKYASVTESLEDQARILKFAPRYKTLQQYTPDNYQAWAKGLQATGYAASPEYAEHLIKLIRHYKLYKFDQEALKRKNGKAPTQQLSPGARQRAKRQAEREEKAKAERQAKITELITPAATPTTPAVPEKASRNEQPIIVNSNYSVGETRILRLHDVDRINGVKFIVAQEGDTHLNIARSFRLDLKKLLDFNDIPANMDVELKKGDLVFLQAKRPVAARGYAFHQVQDGESMYSISQMYAIRLPNLYKLNKMKSGDQLTVGRILKLR